MSLLTQARECPFCDGVEVWMWDKGVPGKFAVSCSNPECAATGPLSSIQADAIRNWNKALRITDPPSRRKP